MSNHKAGSEWPELCEVGFLFLGLTYELNTPMVSSPSGVTKCSDVSRWPYWLYFRLSTSLTWKGRSWECQAMLTHCIYRASSLPSGLAIKVKPQKQNLKPCRHIHIQQTQVDIYLGKCEMSVSRLTISEVLRATHSQSDDEGNDTSSWTLSFPMDLRLLSSMISAY